MADPALILLPQSLFSGAALFRLSTERGKAMKYKIALHRTDEGYAVSVPGLPGCWSQGETEAEALANIQDAIQEYLAARDELLQDAEVREVEVSG